MAKKVAHLSSLVTAYSEKGKSNVLSVQSQGLGIFNVRVQNRSGDALSAGILRKLRSTDHAFYALNSSVYTEISISGSGTEIFDTTNNNGFLIQSTKKFHLVGMTVSTANGSTAGVYAYKYWDGSAFQTVSTVEVPTDYKSTGDAYVVAIPDYDWTVGGPTGTNGSKFSVLIQHTTAPAAAVEIDDIWLGQFLSFEDSLADNSSMQIAMGQAPLEIEAGEGLFPYFGTAAAGNLMEVFYEPIG